MPIETVASVPTAGVSAGSWLAPVLAHAGEVHASDLRDELVNVAGVLAAIAIVARMLRLFHGGTSPGALDGDAGTASGPVLEHGQPGRVIDQDPGAEHLSETTRG